MKTLFKITFLFLTASFILPLAASGLKRVMVLDFKNILKKPDVDYLENSITKAVEENMKAKFAYQEISRSEWQTAAKENFISEEDLYTYTAAVNLGIVTKQDVVIFGGYIAEGSTMRARVRILDMSTKTEIADFETSNPIDSTIFDAVDKIADRIVQESRAILPSKDDPNAGCLQSEVPSFSQLSIRSHYAPFALSSNQTVSPAASFTGADFSNTIGFVLDFHKFGIVLENLGWFAGGMVKLANDTFTNQIDGSSTPASLQTFGGQAGVAWRQNIGASVYVQPFTGAGIQYDSMQFEFDNQTVAVTSGGQSINLAEYSLF